MSSQKSITLPASAREPRRQRGKLRVAALLDAAAALFAEKGYDAATMTEIAARANAAIGSLYQFFPSKEALADALLARYGERVGGALRDLADRGADLSPTALADALVDGILDAQSDRAAAIALTEVRGDAAAKRTLVRDAMRRQIAAILRAVTPDLPNAKADAMATMILHMLKAVPVLAEEEERAGQKNLVAEARDAIRLYVSPRMTR